MYHFAEGAFDLPAGFTDRSLNLFHRPTTGGEIIMSVTRETIPDGRSFEELTAQLIQSLSAKLRSFERVSNPHKTPLDVPTVRIAFRWLNPVSGLIYQEQCMALYDRQCVTFGIAGPAHEEERAAAELQSLLASLKLRRPERRP